MEKGYNSYENDLSYDTIDLDQFRSPSRDRSQDLNTNTVGNMESQQNILDIAAGPSNIQTTARSGEQTNSNNSSSGKRSKRTSSERRQANCTAVKKCRARKDAVLNDKDLKIRALEDKITRLESEKSCFLERQKEYKSENSNLIARLIEFETLKERNEGLHKLVAEKDKVIIEKDKLIVVQEKVDHRKRCSDQEINDN